MKRRLQYIHQQVSVTLQPRQILRLPRKMTSQNLTEICWKQLKRHSQCAADPRMIRECEPVSPQPAAQPRLLFALAASILYWKFSHVALQLTFLIHQVLRLPRKVTLQLHQVLRLPPEKRHLGFTKCCACHEEWHLSVTKYCPCHEKWHLSLTSDTWASPCHEKWHRSFTKYCAACQE